GAADAVHAAAARREAADDPVDRARHEGRDGRLGAHHGARPRREDRRGTAAGGAREQARRRGISRKAGVDAAALLEIDDIHTFYGNIEALKGVSLKVEEGEIVTLIGSNGAGKSTTLRSISGLTPPRNGLIRFDGRDISVTAPQDIVQLGISLS